ncbi:hypothetical protein LINPERHAP2_LOCUS33514 [Linum perenne]
MFSWTLNMNAEMEQSSDKVMELIALSLGLKPERLNGFFKDQTRELRTSMWVVLIW